MKKLMFAAVVAAVAGMASADCELPEGGYSACVYPVWDFQMVLVADSHCQCYGAAQGKIEDPCGLGQEADEVCVNWRVPETRIFTGQLYTCDCECITGNSGVAADGLTLAMYDAIRQNRYLDSTNGQEFDKPTLAFSKLYRWGVRGELVAACANLQFDTEGGEKANLTLAGHGIFPWTAKATTIFYSLSGYVAGTLGDALSCNYKKDGSFCNYYYLCADTTVNNLKTLMEGVAHSDMATACAYGQFVIQYNEALTLALTRSTYKDDGTQRAPQLAAILPAWFLGNATKK